MTAAADRAGPARPVAMPVSEWWRLSRLPLLMLTLMLLIGALFAYRQLLQVGLVPLRSTQVEVLEAALGEISREVGDVRRVTRLLRQSLAVRQGLDPRNAMDTALLARQLALFAQTSPFISQLRWMDAEGWERVRVNVGRNRVARLVEKEHLQFKGNRYYFRESMKLQGSEVYVSPLDLNVDNGRVIEPLQPSLRAAVRTRVVDGLYDGVLVINFELGELLQRLHELAPAGMHVELLNGEGYWLLHPDPAMRWGWQIEGRDRANLALQRPGWWRRVSDAGTLIGDAVDGELWSHARIRLASDGIDRDAANHELRVLVATHDGRPAQVRRDLLLGVGAVALAAFVFGVMVIWHLVEARYQRQRLLTVVQGEKAALAHANRELENLLERTRLLQDELVESRRLSSLGMMVAGVAHELNTPTGGALMTLSTLEAARRRIEQAMHEGMSRAELERFLQQTREGLSLASENLQRAAGLIRSFKRLAIDRANESREEFSLAERVGDLLSSMRPRLKLGRIRVTAEIPDDLVLHSYPGIVSQVLQNLVDNALDHGFGEHGGGSLRIAARQAGGGERVRLEVADDGAGIDPALSSSLFDPFVTSGRGQGHTGLGLHLVHQWVHQLLGGKITVQSRPGEGTRFTIVVPRVSPVVEESAAS